MRNARRWRPGVTAATALVLAVGVACSSGEVLPTFAPASGATAPPAAFPPHAGQVRSLSTPAPEADDSRTILAAESGGTSFSGEEFSLPDPNRGLPAGVAVSPSDYRPLLPKDAIRPIYEPTLVEGVKAELDSQALVIGMSIGGESRAYPISVLRFREMVNDELGGVPILVTW